MFLIISMTIDPWISMIADAWMFCLIGQYAALKTYQCHSAETFQLVFS
jgi:hypothetical protein